MINVKDFGAKGDGITDDYLAFQKAEDSLTSGGEISVPAGVYIVSKPFNHKNFVTLYGDGDTSIIRNISGKGVGDEQFCIHIGNFPPSTFGQCVHFDIQDVKTGDLKVTLKNKADISRFAIGEAILIDTSNGFISTDNQLKPYQAFINRVRSISVSKGVIRLEDAVSTDITNAKVALTTEFTTGAHNDEYICQYPVIRDIRFESLGDWSMRFGVYKGVFENISLKTTDVIGGNGFSHCSFKNIRADFSQKVIEMAMYSHDTIVDGLVANWWNGVIDPANKPIIKMGENVRGCNYKNLQINSGQGQNFSIVISYGHCFNNEISNSHFICPTVKAGSIEHSTSDPLAIITGNKTHDNVLELGGGSWYIKIDDENTGADISNNVIENNTFSGAVKQPVFQNGGTNNVILNNTYL